MGISSLDSALSGLRINQSQIDVISTNVANVGTDGYTRKILPQTSQVVNGRSVGVLGENIIRNVDLRLERDLWTQVSKVDFYDVQTEYLGRVENFHGAPDANVSVAAEVSKLQDTFAALANSPDDQFLLADVLNQAIDTADKFNELGDYYNTLRNDVQDEADATIESINDLLEQIAELNSQIRFTLAADRGAAETQDKRDLAIKELSSLIEVSAFPRGDGVLVVQTLEGVELASDTATELVFRPTPLAPELGYPDTAAAVFVGDPFENANALDITERQLGGKLGGLLELRDTTFPKQIAQLDELAHKMALRFDAQGLRLFTDNSGSIPPDTPPDLTTDPPTPVEYIGFASAMQVSTIVVEDRSLIQTGTFTGATTQAGSNDMMRRIIEYTFGEINYQLASNTDVATSVDIQAAATGGTTLQDWLGLPATNTLTSGTSLTNYASIADLVAAGGDDAFGANPPNNDRFLVTFDDPDIGGGPYDIQIDLRSVPALGTSAADDLMNHMMGDPDWASVVADFGATLSVNASGQLVIQSSSNIEVQNDVIDPMTDVGFAFVGFGEETSIAQDPYFDVKVGNNDAVRVTIAPTDTEVELLAKLNAIDGAAAEISADGFLSIRPGNDFTDPDYGGDISIIGGPFETSGASLAGTAAGRAALDDGVNIAQALFGTYQITGGVVEVLSPITDVQYGSETAVGSGTFVGFRTENLGPSTTINAEIDASVSLKDYSQKIINELAQEISLIEARGEDETTLATLLETQLLNESGVNLDQELGNLIVVQTAYAASARVISAISDIFDDLLNVL